MVGLDVVYGTLSLHDSTKQPQYGLTNHNKIPYATRPQILTLDNLELCRL